MTLPISRSEGSLPLDAETHSELFLDPQKAGADVLETQRSSDAFQKRKVGITKAEANCFKRRLVPSDDFEDKVAPYWRHIGGMRTILTQKRANTLPNGKGVFWNGPLFRNTILATEEHLNSTANSFSQETPSSQPHINTVKSRRTGCLKGQKAAQPPHPLDLEEEHLSDILCYLFPSTKAQMARVGSSCRRRIQTPKSRESNAARAQTPLPHVDERGQPHLEITTSSGTLGDTVRLGSSQQGLSTTSPSTMRMSATFNSSVGLQSPVKSRDGSPCKRAKAASTPDGQKSPSKPKARAGPSWLGHDELSQNAMRLVQGASNFGAVHRDLGGGQLSFMHEDVKNHKSVFNAVNHAVSSVGYLVQAMADENHRTAMAPELEQSHSRGGRSPTKLERSLTRSPTKSLHHEARDQKALDPEKAHQKAKEKAHQEHFEQSTFSLREFRKRILEKYSSVMEAFNRMDIDSSKDLTQKEWNVVLFQAGLANYREARLLFEVMDADKNGHLTLLEFHVGIESIAPVLSLEAMRKRFLCVGFSSMWQALRLMDGVGEDTMSKPLKFPEFSDALRHAAISEPAEHRAIFEAVRSDPGPRTVDCRVSLADLAAALAAVSPSLLMEDLLFKLQKQYKTMADAWHHLTLCDSGDACFRVFDLQLFRKQAVEKLGLTDSQAVKLFHFMDIDGDDALQGEVSRCQFLAAFNVSSPCLILEDNRHKVRQRYLSIDVAFRDAFETMDDEDLNDEVGLEVEELCDILEKLEMSRKCTKRLFHLIDSHGFGKLTLYEYFKGVRLYAPAVMLEGVRLQLLKNGDSIANQLCSVVKDRRAPLGIKAFTTVLNKLEVECDHIELLFKFLDVRDVGTVTVSEFIATLQNLAPGMTCKADPSSHQERAEHLVKTEMAPFHKTVTDLKRRVKQGLRENTEEVKPHRKTDDETHGRLPRITRRGKSMPASHKEMEVLARKHQEGEQLVDGVRLPAPEERLLSAGGPPLSRSATAQGPRSTFHKLNTRLKAVENDGSQNTFGTTMNQLKGYFNSAHTTLQEQRPALTATLSRIDLHRSATSLKTKLEPGMVEFRRAADAARV